MKYNIAVCDDDKIQLNLMTKTVEEISQQLGIIVAIDAFSSGEELLSELEHDYHFFHLIFMDMEMGDGKLTGLDTAHLIRKINQSVVIVFVTGFKDYVFNAYEVAAFRYILKPIKKDKLLPVIEAVISKLDMINKERYIEITSKREKYLINQKDILYFEKERNVVTVHTNQQEIQFYSTFSILNNELDPKLFLQIHQGYIVNVRAIELISSTDVLLRNGKHLPVSRRKLEPVKKMLLESMREIHE